MTTRERFLETCKGNRAVAPPKWEFGYWGETVDNWYAEGLPCKHYPRLDEEVTTPTRSMFLPAWRTVEGGKLPKGIAVTGGGLYWPTQAFLLDEDVKEHLGMDYTQELVDVNGLACPMFEFELKFENERYWDFLDVDGIVKRFQKGSQTMPSGWQWPVEDWDTWEKYKEERVRLDNITDRFPSNWPELVQRYKARDFPLGVGGFPHGFFGTLAHLMGYERLFVSYYEEPELVHDIVGTFTDVWMALYEEVLSYTDIDMLHIWEDISFGRGSMVSPDIIREFQMPYYKKMIAFLGSHGVRNIFLDTDGYCIDIIPLFLEAGITGIYPFEWHTGMRVKEVRRQFPELIMMGGIPKSEISRGKARIDEILEPVAETIRLGGYIPYADHLVPPEVHWVDFKYYRRKLNDIIDSMERN